MMRLLGRYPRMLALVAVTMGAAACTDLTEVPYTEITEGNFNPTPADLAAMIGPAYTPLRSMWMSWYGMVDWQGETGDMLLTPVRPNGWHDGGIYILNHEHKWNASSPGMPNSLWGNSFNGINAVNRVLYQIESGVLPIEGDIRTKTEAELKAMRAYYYYLLMDNFGNVPIQTDFTSRDLPQQASRDSVFKFVINEFTDALPNLSRDVEGMYGRMNYWAARGIMARIYLNAEVYTGTPHWDDVLTITQEIIDEGLYDLAPTYSEVFSRANENSEEIIFAVPYDEIYGGSNFHMKTLKPDLRYVFGMTATPWGGSASNPQFIDTYDVDDNRLEDTWLMGPQFDSQGRGYDFVKHVPSMTATQFNNGFPVKKYEIYQGMTGSSSVDYPILRYAEILMMRAEALLRTGDANGAAALVSEVRERDFTGAAASKATVTGAQLLQGSVYNYGWYDTDGVVKTGPDGTPVTNGGADIEYGRFLDELRWEFAVEGHDRQMLIRFGVFTTKTWFNHEPNTQLGSNAIIFPIPQSRINSNPTLVQNPGY